MSTTSLRNRIAAAALTAGAITIGAMAISAPIANAQTFQQSCTQEPQAYDSQAVRGVWSTRRIGNDRYQDCDLYAASGKHLGCQTIIDYGWYLKHDLVEPVSPTLPVRK